MSVSNVYVLFHYLLWKAKLDLSALSKGLDSSHINVSFSMGSIASCGVMKTPSCIIGFPAVPCACVCIIYINRSGLKHINSNSNWQFDIFAVKFNICVVTLWMGTGYIFRFKWKRNNAIYLVTFKMGLVIPISHGNLRITQLPITADNTAVFCRGNFTEKSPELIPPGTYLQYNTYIYSYTALQPTHIRSPAVPCACVCIIYINRSGLKHNQQYTRLPIRYVCVIHITYPRQSDVFGYYSF